MMENLVITLLAGAIGLLSRYIIRLLGHLIYCLHNHSVTLNAPTVDSRIFIATIYFPLCIVVLFCIEFAYMVFYGGHAYST